jgi:hypothetical protein
MRGMTTLDLTQLMYPRTKTEHMEEECPDSDPESCQMPQQTLYPAAPKRLKVWPNEKA